MKATFSEFCEDYLDKHIGLMSESEIAEARAEYSSRCSAAPATKSRFANLSAAELRSTTARHINSQQIAISRSNSTDAISLAREFIASASAAKTRAQMISALDMSADVSRAFAQKAGS